MAIPTAQDHDLSELESMATGIQVRLKVMRYAGRGERDFRGLRDALQLYVDRVMQFAHETGR